MRKNNYTSAPASRLAWKAVLVSLFVMCAYVQVSAQTTQAIRGTVLSTEDQQPIPGANIYLKSNSAAATFSDANGEFRFPNQLKAGDVLVFSFMGLKTTEYVVPEQPAGPVTISMPQDTIQMVDEILVEGSEPAPTKAAAKRKNKIRTLK